MHITPTFYVAGIEALLGLVCAGLLLYSVFKDKVVLGVMSFIGCAAFLVMSHLLYVTAMKEQVVMSTMNTIRHF